MSEYIQKTKWGALLIIDIVSILFAFLRAFGCGISDNSPGTECQIGTKIFWPYLIISAILFSLFIFLQKKTVLPNHLNFWFIIVQILLALFFTLGPTILSGYL